MSKKDLEAELPYLQCLCANCHFLKDFAPTVTMQKAPRIKLRLNELRKKVNAYKHSLGNCLYCKLAIKEGTEHSFAMHHPGQKDGVMGDDGEWIIPPKDFAVADFLDSGSVDQGTAEALVDEIARTVMLCHNCHRIIHVFRTPICGKVSDKDIRGIYDELESRGHKAFVN